MMSYLNTSKVTDKLMGISISSTQVKFIANTMFFINTDRIISITTFLLKIPLGKI